jgi:hypothetical protein
MTVIIWLVCLVAMFLCVMTPTSSEARLWEADDYCYCAMQCCVLPYQCCILPYQCNVTVTVVNVAFCLINVAFCLIKGLM